jgi:CheY-like chemotaxis protein
LTTVLIADDGPTDRAVVGALLRRAGLEVREAVGGREALAEAALRRPDLVLTDLVMPGLDGLALTRALREADPGLPVILMTAHGSEETAAEALRVGASGYVPKRHLADDLVPTVTAALDLAAALRDQEVADRHVERQVTQYVLGSDTAVLASLTAFLARETSRFVPLDETERMQVGVALVEALTNAIHHGNLEVRSALRDAGVQRYLDAIERRRREARYRNRRVRLTVTLVPGEATYVLADEGPGFDPASVPDPRAPGQLDRVHGRGLLLIRAFMDDVRHNEKGNVITLVRRARTSLPAAS